MNSSPLQVARWWIADYAYAVVWQVRGFFNRTDPATFQTGEKTPIVVVPGVYETWKFLQPLITSMHERGHPVHIVELLHLNRRPVADAAGHVADYLAEHGLDDVVIVAHSKGGLIGKYVMVHGATVPGVPAVPVVPAAPGPRPRIRGMLAVAAPFGGSLYARYLLLPSLRIFSPRDATILALTREQTVNSRIVSVFGQFDPHIPGGSALTGAKNVRLETGGHFRILAHPRVIAELTLLAG
jgi:pimeloyl-ACP methyl ester carboxylesterase